MAKKGGRFPKEPFQLGDGSRWFPDSRGMGQMSVGKKKGKKKKGKKS